MHILKNNKGFTAVEMMMVLMIIVSLVALAIPEFLIARESSRQKTCVANLRIIDSAKDMYALDHSLPDGTVIQLTWLIGPYIRGTAFQTSTPESRAEEFRCPNTDMMYGPVMGVIGEPPHCPSPNTQWGPYAHIMPDAN